MTDHRHPDHLTTEERLSEVAAILARGLIRHACSKANQRLSLPNLSASGLEVSRVQSLNAPDRTTPSPRVRGSSRKGDLE